MVVYELTHIFFRYGGELVHSSKKLGLFYSYESARNAVKYYSLKPGFHENQDAFLIRERNVLGNVVNGTVFEVVIYLHSEDYEFETEIGLGLYGDEIMAQDKLVMFCRDNTSLVHAKDLISENIVNKRIVERKEWAEGFSVSE